MMIHRNSEGFNGWLLEKDVLPDLNLNKEFNKINN